MSDETNFIPFNKVTEPGRYDIADMNCIFDEWWSNISVIERDGHLRFIHPEKNIEVAVKGMNGWYFRRIENKGEGE